MSQHLFNTVFCSFPCKCASSADNSDDEPLYEKPKEPVYLNVYDMYKSNEIMSNLGLGIYHSGVEVYGREYGYAGHPHPHTGIFDIRPRNVTDLEEFFGKEELFAFKQSVKIGYTYLTGEEVVGLKNKMGRKFRGNRYHLLKNNCNHFSATFTKLLCRKNIPSWVNRLANFSSGIPFMDRFIPEEWLIPKQESPGVNQLICERCKMVKYQK